MLPKSKNFEIANYIYKLSSNHRRVVFFLERRQLELTCGVYISCGQGFYRDVQLQFDLGQCTMVLYRAYRVGRRTRSVDYFLKKHFFI